MKNKKTIEERFWSKVRKTPECWIWIGERRGKGITYGRFLIYNKGIVMKKYAHRFSYELTYGIFDNKLHVCHHCDNPICVRPDHLFLGTHTDNMRDMFRKNRRSLASIERKFAFMSPSGDKVSGQNLSRFCKENGFYRRSMLHVLDGRLKAYKGWTKAD